MELGYAASSALVETQKRERIPSHTISFTLSWIACVPAGIRCPNAHVAASAATKIAHHLCHVHMYPPSGRVYIQAASSVKL